MLGFSTVFVALGASASVIGALIRAYSGQLAIVAGIVIIVMGLHFLGVTPIALLHRQKRLEVAKPVGLWGAYVMGLGFRVRLDAVHRADPRRDPGGGGVRADGGEGRGPARGLFARPRHSVHGRRLRDRAVRGVSGALSRTICTASSRRWARCWC